MSEDKQVFPDKSAQSKPEFKHFLSSSLNFPLMPQFQLEAQKVNMQVSVRKLFPHMKLGIATNRYRVRMEHDYGDWTDTLEYRGNPVFWR